MKNDPTTMVLNFILIILAIVCVTFAFFNISHVHKLRQIQSRVMQANQYPMAAQSLLNETLKYNEVAKNPELTKLLQGPPPKPAGSR